MALRTPGAAPEAIFQQSALLLYVLADPARIKIISLLQQEPGTLDVTALVAQCGGLSKATISYHLRALYKVGLVSYNRRKHHVFYRIQPTRLREARGIITLLL